jgi:hypothetical protein
MNWHCIKRRHHGATLRHRAIRSPDAMSGPMTQQHPRTVTGLTSAPRGRSF